MAKRDTDPVLQQVVRAIGESGQARGRRSLYRCTVPCGLAT